MIVLILCNGQDRRLLELDVAGLPFSQHLPAQLQSLENVDTYVIDGASAFAGHLSNIAANVESGADVLLIDADVWISMAAVKQLLTRMARRRTAVKVTSQDLLGTDVRGERNVFALCLPAAIASSFLRRYDPASFGQGVGHLSHSVPGCEEVDSHDLDRAQPPVRVTSMVELAVVERCILYTRACDALRRGVRIRDPQRIAIRGDLRCGVGVEIDLHVIIQGNVSLGDYVKVGASSILINTTIGARSSVHPYSIVEDAVVGTDTFIGPYGRVRPGSVIGDSVQIGNFVEIKKSDIGNGSRINHLAFVGDATLGSGVTIGAGTITCNHDGVGIQRTQIGANAYVGSGSELVAPVRIGENATIGAGSTITHDAPAGELTVARSRQVTVGGWTRPSKMPHGK